MADDGFHPNLQQCGRIVGNRVHHVKASDIDADTAQSEGMQRFAAISGRTVGSEKLWMGETHVRPQAASANHHHGESETAIFVLSGHPDFVFYQCAPRGPAALAVRGIGAGEQRGLAGCVGVVA
jgi:hypothetical protein